MSSKVGSVVVVGAVAVASIAGLMVGERGRAAAADTAPVASASVCTDATPPALAAPTGNALAFDLLAEGVQIYSCAYPSGAASGPPVWTLKAPEATLIGKRGELEGSHGAGPTWKALDGSSVVGAKVEAATADPSAIPWLLLRAVSHGGGRGRMTDVTFVQRVQTSGGVAPSEGCNAATVGAEARVPYSAAYCFYRGEGRSEGKTTTPARPPG